MGSSEEASVSRASLQPCLPQRSAGSGGGAFRPQEPLVHRGVANLKGRRESFLERPSRQLSSEPCGGSAATKGQGWGLAVGLTVSRVPLSLAPRGLPALSPADGYRFCASV